MLEKSMRRMGRLIFLSSLIMSVGILEAGEVVENPKPRSLGEQRPELDPQYLRQNGPIVSVLLVEEDHGAHLVTFSTRPESDFSGVTLVSRDVMDRESRHQVEVRGPLRSHLRAFEDLEISTEIDDEMFFPGASLSVWITGLLDEKFVRMRVPPLEHGYSFSGDGKAADSDLAAWVRRLVDLALDGAGPAAEGHD